MAAYAALVSLINTIQDITSHPQISTLFDSQHTHTLLEKTSSLLDFMEANNYGEEDEDLEREITSAAKAAEEVIEFHIADQIYDKTSLGCSLDLQQKIHDMDVVMEKANEFKQNRRSGKVQGAVVPVRGPVLEIEETSMVGLDAELESLLHELTRDPRSSRETISIVGMGGIGKTTLAKNIFENQFIKEHFHFRAWATISEQHSAKEILAQLLPDSKKKLSGDETINELGEKLYKNLFRRYLIILDDIWSVKAWYEVKRFFPDTNNGSKIILTTRLSNVANDCGASIFTMRFLDEENSWKLLCEKVFKNESCPSELLQEVGGEIVKLCKGLALSIVVMGGILSKSPRNVEYWESVARDIKSISAGSLDVLSLSYKHLPAQLKPCFLYMGTFYEDAEISVSTVVKYWISKGFIKQSGSGVLEEIGEGYIKNMIERNLILVRRRRKNGKIKSCGIHDLLRDLCIKLGEQQQFFSMALTSNSTRHSLIFHSADFENDQIPRAGCILASSSSGKVSKGRLPRILRTRHEVELENLYENCNLRYLDYSYKFRAFSSWKLPNSVCLMWNLQTLIILRCAYKSVVVAPREIWNMQKLRHVECGNIYLPRCNQKNQDGSLLILENLQTLKTAVNPCFSMKVIPNIIKLYLYCDENWHEYKDYVIEHICNLDRMLKLESLELDIYFITQKKKPTFPNSLKKLSLKGGLNWDDLVTIGSLPQLEVLILRWIKGDKWIPTTGQFLCLKFLQLEYIDFKYWDADKSHFPVLEKLILSTLYKLEEIPLGIGDILTLELIRVDRCTVSAAISAIKIKEDQLDNGNDSLQIQIRMDDRDVKDFNEKVESGRLSISNIQLESPW